MLMPIKPNVRSSRQAGFNRVFALRRPKFPAIPKKLPPRVNHAALPGTNWHACRTGRISAYAGGAVTKIMPLARYFVFVGGALMALLFVFDFFPPKAAADIGIHSGGKVDK